MVKSIRGRMLLVALLPPLLIALLLGGYFTYSRISELEQHLLTEGRSTLQSLVPGARRALFAGDRRSLQELADAALINPAVAAVTFSDSDGERLLRVKSPAVAQQEGAAIHALRVFIDPELPLAFRAPIHADHLAPSGMPWGGEELPMGWVTIELSLAGIAAAQAQQLLMGAALTLVALLASIAFAVLSGAAVRRSLHALVSDIAQLEQGRLDVRIDKRDGGEFGLLAEALGRMARSLQRGQLELQRKVEQTTSELRETLEAVEIQNVELDLARKRALEGSKVKSEFLANMSHEIRTPINGILGFADLLANTQLDDEQNDYVNTVKESCANLLAIVNDILDFSKIEAGKLVIDNVALDLRDCVEEVLSLLAPTAYGKGLELIHLIYADVPLKLYGDPIRIRQVLTNLAHNAIKFTPSGRVVVRVMLDEETEQEAVLRVTVTDTGIGLDEGDQKKLFHAFSQADTSITRRFGGAGLGLIISRKLLEQMGGSIGLESAPGQGSTFWFTLRCLKQRGASNASSERRETALEGKRILLYDEEPLARLAVKHLLDSWGARVVEADDRQSVLTHISSGRVDLAVVGLSRSQLNHRAFDLIASRIRNLPVPIMVLASTVDRSELRGLYQRGAAATLPKASRRQTMYRELCRLLSTEPVTPLRPEPVALPARPIAESPQPATAADDGRPRVLVVDDNHINRKLVSTILANHAVAVSEAQDGKEAVELARQHAFDLIFMDIHMPVMSGETATRQIQAQRAHDKVPRIIALTANAMPGERERLLACGMDDCLIKPITEEQVGRILRSLNKAEPEPTAVASAPSPLPRKPRRALSEELRGMLLSELPEHKRGIQRAYRNNTLPELKDAVHTLHGAASVCHLAKLKNACAQLESSLGRDDRVAVPEQTNRLLAEIDRLLEERATGS